MATPAVKRKAVAPVVAVHGVSHLRACDVQAVDRSSARYNCIRPENTAERVAIKPVAAKRCELGFRLLHNLLDRQGIEMNLKNLLKLNGEER